MKMNLKIIKSTKNVKKNCINDKEKTNNTTKRNEMNKSQAKQHQKWQIKLSSNISEHRSPNLKHLT